jgi:hypothetical protein
MHNSNNNNIINNNKKNNMDMDMDIDVDMDVDVDVDVDNSDFIPPGCDKSKEVDKIIKEEDGCNYNIEALKEGLWTMTFAAFTLTLPILAYTQ